jgi:hypothetical protein
MAATYTERWSPIETQLTEKGWTARRSFDVVGVSTEMDAWAFVTADLAGPLVNINSVHPRNGLLQCHMVYPKHNGFNAWVVDCDYGIPENGQFVTQTTNFLSKKPTVRWRPALTSDNFDCTNKSEPVTNSARRPFSSNPSKNYFSVFLTITRNEPFYDLNKAATYSNTVNNLPFILSGLTFAKGWVYLSSYAPTGEYESGGRYVSCSYDFEIRVPIGSNQTALAKANPFQLRIRDEGRTGIYSDDGGATLNTGQFVMTDGTPITEDVLLDGTGKPINSTIKIIDINGVIKSPYSYPSGPAGATVDVVSVGGSTAVWLIYQRYDGNDFNQLGLTL